MAEWTRFDQTLPPVGVVLETLSYNGMEQKLIYASNLWWFPDMSMYIYYTPEFWREF